MTTFFVVFCYQQRKPEYKLDAVDENRFWILSTCTVKRILFLALEIIHFQKMHSVTIESGKLSEKFTSGT
jgi:hypothetical protein